MITSPTSRTLHLVDLENLVGGPYASAVMALATLDTYLNLAQWQLCDHVIVAAHPQLVLRIAFDIPISVSLHSAHGRDGADLMLLSLAPPELIVKRYTRLVIGSGDGIFSERARIVRRKGVTVDVVALEGCCSKQLRRYGWRVLDAAADVVLAA